MRLDKLLSHNTHYSRKQIKLAVRAGRVSINAITCKDPGKKVQECDDIVFDGTPILQPAEHYYLLNKPAGYCCSHEDDGYPSIFRLLPDVPQKLHIAGRLDADTTGLLLISSDGQWCHRVTSPKQQHKKNKVYQVHLAAPLLREQVEQLANGVQLISDDKPTLPATVIPVSDTCCLMTIQEGRYHQVKRMFAAVGNKVVRLHRTQVGEIHLDKHIAEGQCRPLTPAEIQSFFPTGKTHE